MAGMAIGPDAILGFAGAVIAGYGIGSIASASLTGLMKDAQPHDYGLVSTAWNFTFDLGIAIGGLGLGLVVSSSGYRGAFLVLALLMAVAFALTLVKAGSRRRATSGSA